MQLTLTLLSIVLHVYWRILVFVLEDNKQSRIRVSGLYHNVLLMSNNFSVSTGVGLCLCPTIG